MELILLIDFGSTFTKLTAVDLNKEMVVATAKAPTTVDTHIMEGLNAALNIIYHKLAGQKYEIIEKIASSSAAGGLRMSAIGLVPRLTVEAAQTALLSSGAKLVSSYAYEMGLEDIDSLMHSNPDIILLSGGTDGGNRDVIIHNAKRLANSELNVPILMCGNRSVKQEVCDILSKTGKEVIAAENVLPELNRLNIDSVRKIIRDLFINKIIQAKGIDEAMAYADKIMMPTPVAVLNAAKLIAEGTKNETGMGELIVLDIGGATSDVYSIGKGLPINKTSAFMKGIPEPYEKRTVEGDLGVRYNAQTILEKIDIETFVENLNIPKEEIIVWVNKISTCTETLAVTDKEKAIDVHLAYHAARISVSRHVGYIESYQTSTGVVYAQYGKDLTQIKAVIGTGGPLIHITNPYEVLKATLFDPLEPEKLRPQNPAFYLDRTYILYAVGLMSEQRPDLALRIAKKYLQNEC